MKPAHKNVRRLWHIEIDGGYPKKKRVLVLKQGSSEPCVFLGREAARQYIRNHLRFAGNPRIVEAPF